MVWVGKEVERIFVDELFAGHTEVVAIGVSITIVTALLVITIIFTTLHIQK